MSEQKTTHTYTDELVTLGDYGFTRTGYSLDKWTQNRDGSGTSYGLNSETRFNSNTTLYAHWNPNNYTITFNVNGGIAPSSWTSNTRTVKYDSQIGTLPPQPTKTGYAFNGWYTSSSGGTPINANTICSGNATYYANWNPNKYNVSFDLNGLPGYTPDSIEVTYDALYGQLPSVSVDGITFNGWYTAKSGGSKVTSSTNVNILNDITLYAIYIL